MIDIHCHLIFGVDDGSRNLDESLKMVDMYLQSGFNGAILTSHYYRNKFIVDKNMVNEGLEKLREGLDNRGIDFSIYPGNEVMVDDKILKDYDNDKISTLNNSKYILICSFCIAYSTPYFFKHVYFALLRISFNSNGLFTPYFSKHVSLIFYLILSDLCGCETP